MQDRVRVFRLLVAVAVLVLGAVTTGWAHDAPGSALVAPAPAVPDELSPPSAEADRPVSILSGAAPSPDLPWLLAALAIATLSLACRWPRRAVGLAAILVLAVFAFESGLHSVHHLNNPDQATQCAAASASGQVSGTIVSCLALDAAVIPTGDRPVSGRRDVEPAAPLRSHDGRAPPLRAS